MVQSQYIILDFFKDSLSEVIEQIKGFQEVQPQDWVASIKQFLTDWHSQERSILVKTSGSTGKAKTIELQKSAMQQSAKATILFFNLQFGQTALLALPCDYIAGKMMLVRAIQAKLKLICVQPKSKLNLPKTTIDFAALTPMQAQISITELKSIKTLILGGAKVSKQLQQQIQELHNLYVYETYGMTETITHIAVKRLHPIAQDFFKLLPNIGIRTDKNDCLIIDAPKISEQSIYTKDVVKVIDNEQFIWLGRLDNVINSGGVKINPEMVERKLQNTIQYPFFISSVADDLLGERLILIVESTNGNEKEVLQQIKSNQNKLGLSKIEIPKQVFLLTKFIRTKTNKIQRQQTKALIFKNRLD